MIKCESPKVSIQSDKLILSLPDALTPVMWMIDIKESGTFLMRIEQDDRGLFILQKLSSDGKKVEDIAYYSKKKNAVHAMTAITKTMSEKKTHQSKLWCVLSMIKSGILLTAAICILLITFFIFVPLGGLSMIFGSNVSSNVIEQPIQSEQQTNSGILSDPNAIGVPMSADDFLQQKGKSGLPF